MTRQFIPAADEVGHLQSGDDPECRLFQKIAEQGHYAGRTRPSSTRQGTYATTADGRLLASWNNNDPRFVASKLREAIAKWERIQAEGGSARDVPQLEGEKLERPDRFYPRGGLVLHVFTRDLPRDPPQSSRHAESWNQDFAWFKREEAQQFLPPRIELHEKREVPRPLVERLARVHFLDNVRGQTTLFPAKAVQEAQLTSEIISVQGDLVELRLEGRTRTDEQGKWSINGYADMHRPSSQRRGVQLRLLGFARYERKQERFVSFELVAAGTRWGGSQYNGRAGDLQEAPFGVVLSLAGESPADRVPPEHFWAYGWR